MKSVNDAKDLKILSQYLDSKFKGPFGIRFGFDSVIGLVPGLGDSLTSLLSLYIILRGASLGVSHFVLLRMTMNSLVDYTVGLVPLIGDAFDLYWKANDRNYKLIEAHLKNPIATKRQSIVYLIMALIIGVFILIAPILLLFIALSLIF
jgi:hypothetical protein